MSRDLWLTLLLASAGCSFGDVPINTPFQIVRPTPNHSSMVTVPEGLAKLQEHRGDIALVSVVGPYHSGKSFLLNSLLNDPKAFSVGRKTSPETMGIWICRTSLTAADGSEVWLMDSEGFFGPGVDEGYDAKVFTIAALLGSHLVYNSVKVIDQQAVSLLEILMHRAQLFRSRTSVHASERVPDFLLTESFPPLTWVVEDFVQELPPRFQQEGMTGYLTTYLAESGAGREKATPGSTNKTEDNFITKVFRDVRVHTLFLPATKKEQLQDLSRLSWDELTKEYRAEVEALRQYLLRNIRARRFQGKTATGTALANAMHFVVQALQHGMFHELPSLWSSWASQVADMALNDADQWFAMLIGNLNYGNDPMPISQFNSQAEHAREKAMAFYRHLIKDFSVWPNLSELRTRMNKHFERVVDLYNERVKRWVHERQAWSKERLAVILGSFALPVDPAVLEKAGRSETETLMRNFTSQLKVFSAPGARTSLGQQVKMPAFSQDPTTQLTNDMRAQIGARSMENDREVQRVLKEATAAAEGAVENELKSGFDMLMSKAQFTVLQQKAEQACWSAFDDQVRQYSWIKTVSLYRPQRALVQKEAYEARVARLEASNEKQRNSYLQTGLQRLLATYRDSAQSIPMPAATGEVQAAHKALAAKMEDNLAEHGKPIADTEAYKNAVGTLQTHMNEGLRQLQTKNIEVWKAWSDVATRCAVQANFNVERQCGYICFFRIVPWVHKATCRRHLNECFAKDPVYGSRMSADLQAQVFDAWYRKDLGSTVERVWTRFYAWLVTLTVLFAGAAWWKRWGRYGYWRFGWNGYNGGSMYYQQPRAGYGPGCYATPAGVYSSGVYGAPGMVYRGGA
mmetsp:Transcript_150121/g.279877  ORF Transcript_150121/g.279877 Transcript_150121/m.279877 type:complete len:856 (-) Transcript_150121:19-2586(-)